MAFAPLTATGNSALHYAAQTGSRSIVEVLLVAGADREARNGQGMTPLDVVPEGLGDLHYFMRIYGYRDYRGADLLNYMDVVRPRVAHQN
jgi:hypothetical protein